MSLLQAAVGLAQLISGTAADGNLGWEKGPSQATARKTRSTPIAEYVGLVQQLETAMAGKNLKQIVRRLRRLAYSNFSFEPGATGVGTKFDEIVAATDDNPDDKPPLTTDEVAKQLLDNLYSVGTVTTPSGSSVDITHALGAIDIGTNGAGVYGAAASAYSSVNLNGLVTWTGDLASIWRVWMDGRAAKNAAAVLQGGERTDFEAALTLKASLSDLLGDIDGQVIAVIPDLTSKKLSDVLSSYYVSETDPTAKNSTTPNASQRFHLFVKGAKPEIPHSVLTETPVRCTIDTTAVTTIAGYLSKLALEVWTYDPFYEGDKTNHDKIFSELASRFITFLTKGLAGQISWPIPPPP